MKKYLSNLPSERQGMALLTYEQGQTRDEFTTQKKKPATTIKTLLRRSLTGVKQCLDGKS